MSTSQQVLKSIDIHELEELIELNIGFTEQPLTAILGPNGIGKSTVLHALSSVNSPVDLPSPTVNHRLSEFFTPTTHSSWTGSSFHVVQDFRIGTYSSWLLHKNKYRNTI
jgi:predicted ATP-binding protein involved in virulence